MADSSSKCVNAEQDTEHSQTRLAFEDLEDQDDYYLSGLFDIGNSPAFKALDGLKNRKDFTDDRYYVSNIPRIAALKHDFNELHSFLVSLHSFEKSMAAHLRQSLQDMTLSRLEKDRAISKQFSGNAEIGELTRELLKVSNP